jgi:hypothetical protein
LVRGLAPPGYLPASLPGLEELSHRFRATTDKPQGEKLEVRNPKQIQNPKRQTSAGCFLWADCPGCDKEAVCCAQDTVGGGDRTDWNMTGSDNCLKRALAQSSALDKISR